MTTSRPPIVLRDRLSLDQDSRQLSLTHRGEAVIEGATASVTYRAGDETARLSLDSPDASFCLRGTELRLSREDEHLLVQWHIVWEPELAMWLDVRNTGCAAVQIDELIVLSVLASAGGRLNLGAAPRRWTFYQHGWSSGSPAMGRHVGSGMYVSPDDDRYRKTHRPHGESSGQDHMESEWIAVLWGRGGAPRRPARGPGGRRWRGPLVAYGRRGEE